MKTFIFAILSIAILSCADNDAEQPSTPCGTAATIRDLTGLDGCGFVFELEDGTRLEPVWVFECGTPPLPEQPVENVFPDFEMVDGKEVWIDYELASSPSICMVGQTVIITCISERDQPTQD